MRLSTQYNVFASLLAAVALFSCTPAPAVAQAPPPTATGSIAATSPSKHQLTITVDGTFPAIVKGTPVVLSLPALTVGPASVVHDTVRKTDTLTRIRVDTVRLGALPDTSTRIDTTHQSHTDTTSAPPATPSSALCPNEPSTYTLIDDNPWDAIPKRGISTPHGWIADANTSTDNIASVVDPTAPGSPAHVADGVFPAGSPGGSATFYTYRPFASAEQYKNLYICLYVKHSADFDNTNGNTGSKFIWPAGDQVGGALTYASHDNATMDFAIIQQGAVDRIMEANLNYNAARMASFKGQWVRYEILLKANTSNSTANGALDVWMNGVHTHSYTNVNWQMAASRTWQSLAWNATYGGGLHPVPHTQHQYLDHLRISGSNR